MGEGNRWHSLVDRCVKKVDKEYTYKICFYEEASQDHTSLGRFEGWAPFNPMVMLFTRGQSCPGGLDRSMRVTLVCGAIEEILTLSEPSRCAYDAHVSHPGACRTADLEALEAAADIALMPHLEL